MTKEGYVELHSDQMYEIGNGSYLCKHCGKAPRYDYEYRDHYDKDEWYECNCETVNLIASKRKECGVLERQLATISEEIKRLSSKESDTVKNLCIQKEIQAVLNKHKVGIGKVTEIFK